MKSFYRLLVPSVLLCLAVPVAMADSTFTATPGVSAEIPNSKGKFDFLRIDPMRQRLLAAHENDGTWDVIDLHTGKVLKRVKVGGAVDTALDSDSKFYYVSVQEAERVAVLDAETLAEVKSIKMPGPTDAIIYDPANRMLYVTFDNGDAVWVVDPAAGKVVATIKIPGAPEFIVYDAKKNRIYLNIKTTNSVVVIDPVANTIIAQWPTAPALAPHGLAVDEANHRVYSSGNNGKLVSIDTTTGAVTGSADIVQKVDQIAFDAAGGLVYCAGTEKISVVSTAGGKLTTVGDITSAATAKNVAVDPTNRAVWTTYTDGKSSFAKSWLPKP